MNTRVRRTTVTLALATALTSVAAVAVAVAMTACTPERAAPSAPVAASSSTTPERLTLEVAAEAFQGFVNNNDVARASGDERLALAWTSDGQSALTAAEFGKASFAGAPVPRYTYGKPTFYVPRLTNFPQWFVVATKRTTRDTTRDTTTRRTVLMAFMRKAESARWRLSLSTLLDKSAQLPRIEVDEDGYATPLATFDLNLIIQPRLVPSMQATLAEEGPTSLVSRVLKTGRYTSGYHTRDEKIDKEQRDAGFAWDSIYTATSYPSFPLRTADGGGLVLYALSRDMVTVPRSPEAEDTIPVPDDAAHLLETLVVRKELAVVETHQYLAIDPAKPDGDGSDSDRPDTGKPAAVKKAEVIAHDGAPTQATVR